MSTINYTYNVIVDRFRQFAAGHFQLRRFTHGEISQADLEKEAEWPWMHVKPRAINYSPGTRAFSFEIFISDLPRDKEDKTGYQAESITDCSLIFQDLINEIHLGQMFGDDVLLTRPVNSEPFVEQYTHTLTGVTGIIELSMDYDWSACSIPASWNYNTPTNSNSSGFGSLQFIESLEQNGVFVSLDNDLEAPGNSYYYGTNGAGVKGWYASQAGTVTSVGLTAGTGISVSGGPITSSGSITVTNSAPDQVVALTAGTGITTSGTYPNFTITNSAPSSGGTVTSVAALTLGTTGTDLSSTVATSTTTPVITLNVPTASAANRGALSSADWSAFNGKFTLPALTSGSVLFSNGTTIAQDNANLFFDNTNNRLGIGTASPATTLQIVGTTTLRAILPELDNTYNIGSATFRYNNIYARAILSGASTLDLYSTISSFFDSVGNRRMTIVGSSGNVIIGSSATDAGYKLDVNGTARVQGILTTTADARINTLTIGLGGGQVSTNIALGLNALGDNTTGYDNTAIGTQALGDNTIGESSTAVGYYALQKNTTGNNNSAFGYASLLNNLTASNHTASGTSSLRNLTSGSYNTAFGVNAARYIADGATNLTTSSTSIFIGSLTKPLANSQTNQIVIGYDATGLGSNSVVLGNSSITLTALRGNVLIGTTTDAGFKLDVNGTARVVTSITTAQFRLSALNTAPASATATGTLGEIRIDASYIYVCTATNTWKRSAITTW